MEHAGRQDKADTVGERVGGLGQLGTVRIVVEDRPDADDDGSEPDRRLHGQRHHGEDMVDAGDRVGEACGRATEIAGAGMGEGWRGEQHNAG